LPKQITRYKAESVSIFELLTRSYSTKDPVDAHIFTES